jgi:N-acetylmuramoyl-L-alanine amidase
LAIRITIDPGHGQYGNPYPPRKGYYEGTQMWKLANYLKPELEKYGFVVVTTRPKVTDDPPLSTRGKMAGGHDLIISLHSNAPAKASDTKPTGSVIFRTIETPEIGPLCDKIGKKVSEIMEHHYRGTMTKESGSRPGKNYNGVLRNAMAAGCKAGILIEHGFHTNLKDSAFLIKDENLKKLAIAEAEIIAEWFGKKEVVNLNYLDQTSTLYRGIKNNYVKQLQQDLIKLGYSLSPYGADGSFGKVTEDAVKKWQKDNGLVVDGKFGPASRAKMAELLKAPEKDYKKLYEDEKKKREAAEKRLNEVIAGIKKLIG